LRAPTDLRRRIVLTIAGFGALTAAVCLVAPLVGSTSISLPRAFDRALDDSPDAVSSDKPRILFDVAELEALSYCYGAAVWLFRAG